MDKVACRYAIIQFRPYVETGEFANMGVVLTCPATGFFDYRIQTAKTKRFTDFFKPLEKNDYLSAAKYFAQAMEAFKENTQGLHQNAMREQFNHLVHPRETIIRFGQPRAILTNSPADELDRLYTNLVCHAFATKQHVEDVMTRSIAESLRALNLKHPFKPPADTVVDGPLSFKLPLVQSIGDVIVKGIKPLNLDLQDPNEIFDKGSTWAGRFNRLRDKLPGQVAFVVNPPANVKDAGVIAVARETEDALRSTGAVIILAQDKAGLNSFATQ